MDEHVVVKEGEQFSSLFNDTRMIGEEVNITYTVTSAARDCMMQMSGNPDTVQYTSKKM